MPKKIKKNPKKEIKITKKQKEFADKIIEGKSPPQAAKEVYNIGKKHGTKDPANVAHAIASENLQKPIIKSYLEDKGNKAATVIEDIMDNPKTENRIRLDAAKFIHDHAFGKATQRINLGGQKDNPLLVRDVSTMTDDELQNLLISGQ